MKKERGGRSLFYMDREVMRDLKEFSKETGISMSKIVNKSLKSILEINKLNKLK